MVRGRPQLSTRIVATLAFVLLFCYTDYQTPQHTCMIPIGDDNSDRKIFPFVNIILIGINILVFIVYQKFGTDLNFTFSYATVPAEIMTGHDIVTDNVWVKDPLTGQSVEIPGLGVTPVSVYITLFTSM